jgi:hypothetical protein
VAKSPHLVKRQRTLWPKGQSLESSSPRGVTITVLPNKKQVKTGLYEIGTAEKGKVSRKEDGHTF